jgi:membrane-associated phospholipid phosphatase
LKQTAQGWVAAMMHAAAPSSHCVDAFACFKGMQALVIWLRKCIPLFDVIIAATADPSI